MSGISNVEVSYCSLQEGTLVPVHSENPCTLATGPLIPQEAAYADCVTRLQQVFDKVKNEVPCKNGKEITCAITHEPIVTPGVVKCGHVFEKAAIDKWLKEQNQNCPTCRKEAPESYPIGWLEAALKGKKSVVMTSAFQGDQPKLASQYLELAKECEEGKNYREALKAYKGALRYTKELKIYAEVPLFTRSSTIRRGLSSVAFTSASFN